jgi:hypothetical protein
MNETIYVFRAHADVTRFLSTDGQWGKITEAFRVRDPQNYNGLNAGIMRHTGEWITLERARQDLERIIKMNMQGPRNDAR